MGMIIRISLRFCLDLPVVTYVSKVDEATVKTATVRRLVEDGYEMLEMTLPGVITVVKEVASPRLPTLRGKQRARKTDIPTWGPAELGIDPAEVGLDGSPTRVVKVFRPAVTRQCEKLIAHDDHTIDTATDRLVEILQEKNLI